MKTLKREILEKLESMKSSEPVFNNVLRDIIKLIDRIPEADLETMNPADLRNAGKHIYNNSGLLYGTANQTLYNIIADIIEQHQKKRYGINDNYHPIPVSENLKLGYSELAIFTKHAGKKTKFVYANDNKTYGYGFLQDGSFIHGSLDLDIPSNYVSFS